MEKRQIDNHQSSSPHPCAGLIPACLLSLAMAIGINAAILSDWQRLILHPRPIHQVEKTSDESQTISSTNHDDSVLAQTSRSLMKIIPCMLAR